MPNPFARFKAWLNAEDIEQKYAFGPADPSVNWQHIDTLIHGPAAWQHPEANDGNSAAFACLQVLASSAIEPRLRVYRDLGDSQPEPLENHPAQALLDDPNPVLTPEELYFWLYWSLHCDGNSYLLKRRAGSTAFDSVRGNVVELWPVSPLRMTPVTEKNSQQFIDYYSLQVSQSQKEPVPVENVIHLRLGLDDQDHRLGLAPFKRLVRAIGTDEEADIFVQSFLRNYGTPGLFILLQDAQVTEEKAREIKERFQTEFSGEGRGRVGILNNGADVKTVGSTLEQANTDKLREVPEARIAAVLGVPPAMAGLSVGLAQTSNFASMKQVAENFTERKLVPLWRMTSAKLSHRSGLREDFFASDPNIVIRHDLNPVRALQEDEDSKFERYTKALTAGGISLQEYRTALGYESEVNPEETLYIPGTLSPTKASDSVPEPGEQPALPEAEPEDGNEADELAVSRNGQKARRSVLSQFPELLESMVELQAPAMRQDVDSVLDRQRRRLLEGLNGNGH